MTNCLCAEITNLWELCGDLCAKWKKRKKKKKRHTDALSTYKATILFSKSEINESTTLLRGFLVSFFFGGFFFQKFIMQKCPYLGDFLVLSFAETEIKFRKSKVRKKTRKIFHIIFRTSTLK